MRGTGPHELHPWNTGFEWEHRSGPYRYLDEAQARHFDEHGYLVVDDLVDEVLLSDVLHEIDTFERKVEQLLEASEGYRFVIAEPGAITFSTNLVASSTILRGVACHQPLLDLCADLVGPDVNLYWDQAVYKKPDKPRRFPWHQDNGYTFVEPQHYLTIWLALTDATIDNGCPWIAPGFHREGTLAHTFVDPLGWECFAECATAVAAPVKAGSAVVFSSLTPHLTGPNVTEDVRRAYILQYAPAGAVMLQGDPLAGPPTGRHAADAPTHQFPVLRDGVRCDAG